LFEPGSACSVSFCFGDIRDVVPRHKRPPYSRSSTLGHKPINTVSFSVASCFVLTLLSLVLVLVLTSTPGTPQQGIYWICLWLAATLTMCCGISSGGESNQRPDIWMCASFLLACNILRKA